jgi:hypothetical protein
VRTAAVVVCSSLLAGSVWAEPESTLPERANHPPLQLMATAFAGDGLRFNNPYRLSTPLGSSAESVSRTNAYADLGLAVTFGDPRTVQHGFAARLSFAVEGVPQGVLAPSYLVWWRPHPALAAYARVSTPIVLTPNVTWGMEGGLGGVWFFRAGLGAAAELVGDVYYGAGTRDVKAAAYPVLSAQLGFVIAYEVLP